MAFNLFPQTDFRQMDLNYVLDVSKQAAANLEEYAADKEQVVATQAAAERALAAAQEDIQTASAAATSASQDAQTASAAAGTATQAATSASQDAQTASSAAQTAQHVQESIPADYTQLSNDVDALKSYLSFYDFGYCTGRIDWDTVNNTITIGRGAFVYGGGYYNITSAITLSYSNFTNTTVLLYNGSTFEFKPFNKLVAGKAVALFTLDKMYTPFDYSEVYVNGAAITTSNVFNDFAKFVNDINTRFDNIDDTLNVLTQEIHVGEGLDFEEIQDAIESVNGNYATIIVHPKNTSYGRFSLMRSLSETYPWSGLAAVKHISIIGVDKSKCVIQSNTGNYDTPPAEIATNGIIKNLTFIATHSASDGTETTGSYAVHVDNRPRDTNGMKLTFENCDFISYQTAAVGLGLYLNQDITFDNCNFKSYTDSTWKPSEGYNSTYMCSLGAFFMHTAMNYAAGNMFIRFKNCMLYHEGGNYAIRIEDADAEKTAYFEAINNTLWDATNQNAGYFTNNKPIMQMTYNHGNNASELNQMS